MRQAIVFEARRVGYDIQQVADGAMTVGLLKALLEDWDDDDLFILSHDNGYTFGSISTSECMMAEEDEEGDWKRIYG